MDIAQGSGHLLDYWSVLVRRRWVIYLSVIALTLFALVASFIATPFYKATATLQIERHTPNILSFRDLSQADYSWTSYSDFYQTQYKLIASAAVPIMLMLTQQPRLAALALLFTLLLYWRHADNIGRLLRGEEGRIGASKS